MNTLTTQQTFEDAVLKTVMFWSDKSFRTSFNQNNGDDSPNGRMAFMLMNFVANKAQESVSDDKIKMFEDKLTELLKEDHEQVKWGLELSVDYNPCDKLYLAAKFAGIDPSCFPCKTFTRIEKDLSVTAKYQYGGQFIKL